ncbi:glycolate oxidase iron-sulfur subunit [Deinococcus grandis]|uniref:Glycolate oxidase iron-sulfur subunit n=1 Tax=Deinococcus grandis TaxID=57498 RepID=A0A117DND2_9DEIO|nr:glycolate oxidase subunit GlcF [Deinococcus grandis]BBN95022.1 glycolate oxidase iron-sulfur subunit [Deinococcus grandis]GAQ21479.1 glycolate oxidase iron-sulfur subunit [Deinococcus grandis]
MNNDIPVQALGGQGEVMAHAVDACVHCGFCLPACPTYALLGDEMDSPRGRIVLMKEVLEGGLPLADAAPHLDRCLGCQACVTACPSGVPYGELITAFRGWSEPQRQRSALDRSKRWAILKALPAPKLFSVAARVGQFAKTLAPVLPAALRGPLDLLPESVPAMQPSPKVTPARGVQRGRVAFLVGCAQQALAPNFNAATLRVLARNGIEVVIPDGQGCCGAAALHTGARDEALKLVRANLDAFNPDDFDAILSNAAGCGAGLKEYPMVLHGEPDEARAKAFAAKVMDISEYLNTLLQNGELEPPVPASRPLTVAYHDACHLAHAQGVRAAPRALLRAIPGVRVLEVPEGDLCCGSAGTYNLEQPDLAGQLGARKAKNILSTTPDLIASGNIGCHTQIQSHVRRQGSPTPVLHTIEILDRAYRGEL